MNEVRERRYFVCGFDRDRGRARIQWICQNAILLRRCHSKESSEIFKLDAQTRIVLCVQQYTIAGSFSLKSQDQMTLRKSDQCGSRLALISLRKCASLHEDRCKNRLSTHGALYAAMFQKQLFLLYFLRMRDRHKNWPLRIHCKPGASHSLELKLLRPC